jgi:hypothetical protein
MGRKDKTVKLQTTTTDLLLANFMAEPKFNEKLRHEFNDVEEKLRQKALKEQREHQSSTAKNTLPSSSSKSSGDSSDTTESSKESSTSSSSDNSSTSTNNSSTKTRHKKSKTHFNNVSDKREKKKRETAEERKLRGRTLYAKLEKLKVEHGIPVKDFDPDDDPDEMQEEYDYHADKKERELGVKWYRKWMLNILSGVEYLNGEYDPFSLKLDGWTDNVNADEEIDDILEEIYEKYKSKGSQMAPEWRLLLALVLSGATFHVSQVYLGGSGTRAALKENPKLRAKIMADIPVDTTTTTNKNGGTKAALERFRKAQQAKKMADTQTQTQTQTTATEKYSTKKTKKKADTETEETSETDIDDKLNKLTKIYDSKLKAKDAEHKAQIDQILSQLNRNQAKQNIPIQTQYASNIIQTPTPTPNTAYKYEHIEEEPIINIPSAIIVEPEHNFFDSETKKDNKKAMTSSIKPGDINLFDTDSLASSDFYSKKTATKTATIKNSLSKKSLKSETRNFQKNKPLIL